MPNIPTYVEDLEALDRTAQTLGQLLEESSQIKHAASVSPSDEAVLERLHTWNTAIDKTIGACDMRDVRIVLSEALSPIDSTDIVAGFHARRQAAKEARDILREEKTRIGMAMDNHEKSTRSATYGEYEVKPTGEVLLNGTELGGLAIQTKKLLVQFLESPTRSLTLDGIKHNLWGEIDGLHKLDSDVHKVVSKLNRSLPRINRERRIRLTQNSDESYILHSE